MSNISGDAEWHEPKKKASRRRLKRLKLEPTPTPKKRRKRKKVPPKPLPPDYEACSIAQFCAKYSISPSYYWKLQLLGLGPHVLKLRGRRFITRQAAEAWLQSMEVSAKRLVAEAAVAAVKTVKAANADT